MRGLLLCFIFIASSALAAIEAYRFESPEMEANFIKLTNELRCLVCQNQSLADSNADLAKDLRRQTYEMLMQGKTPDQVVAYMVERYGDFVLYRPQFKTGTLLLWLGPFALLLLVLVLVIRHMRGRQKLAPPDAQAMQKAHQLLSNTQEKQ
jgi:cytochrome c-type biogenesis protein CcmH